MRIVVQSMDHYERLKGGDSPAVGFPWGTLRRFRATCGGISLGNAPEIPGYLRRDFLGLRLRRTLTACRRGPCKVCFLSGISSLRSDIPARLRRDFLGLRPRRTLTACRRGPCKPMAGSLSTAVLRHFFAAEPTLGKIAFSPGFRRYAPTSRPACGGAVQIQR